MFDNACTYLNQYIMRQYQSPSSYSCEGLLFFERVLLLITMKNCEKHSTFNFFFVFISLAVRSAGMTVETVAVKKMTHRKLVTKSLKHNIKL